MSGVQEQLSKSEMRKIFKRHRGSITALARDLDLTKVTVSAWLRGRVASARISDAAHVRVQELLAAEQAAGKGGRP